VVQHEAIGRLRAEVEYLQSPVPASGLRIRIAHAALSLHRPLGYLNGLGEILASPDFSRLALRRSVILAHRLLMLGSPPVYVHFAHKPATVGRFAALLAGVPYGLSAHAKDIWVTSPTELARKVRDASVVLTCSSAGRAYLEELAEGRTPVSLVYHGVDTAQFAPSRATSEQPVILSIGRLVEKKGHATLIEAAALLRERGLEFRLHLAGEGPEWPTLQRLVRRLGIADRVAFLGPLTEPEVRAEYARAHLFALPCRELESGDRDGIPNVILEAMACGLPVASTFSSGVAEAVVDGECGLLVRQRDAAALAGVLERLLRDQELRTRLGKQARARAVGCFDRSAHLGRVLEVLRSARLLPQPLRPGLHVAEPPATEAA
jgi:glycosyltransferase involved in cell wall biosynthesis